jgi:hypothetical protein
MERKFWVLTRKVTEETDSTNNFTHYNEILIVAHVHSLMVTPHLPQYFLSVIY